VRYSLLQSCFSWRPLRKSCAAVKRRCFLFAVSPLHFSSEFLFRRVVTKRQLSGSPCRSVHHQLKICRDEYHRRSGFSQADEVPSSALQGVLELKLELLRRLGRSWKLNRSVMIELQKLRQGRLRRLSRRLKGRRTGRPKGLRSSFRQSARHHRRGQEEGHRSRGSLKSLLQL